jgi:hypothetical protein
MAAYRVEYRVSSEKMVEIGNWPTQAEAYGENFRAFYDWSSLHSSYYVSVETDDREFFVRLSLTWS